MLIFFKSLLALTILIEIVCLVLEFRYIRKKSDPIYEKRLNNTVVFSIITLIVFVISVFGCATCKTPRKTKAVIQDMQTEGGITYVESIHDDFCLRETREIYKMTLYLPDKDTTCSGRVDKKLYNKYHIGDTIWLSRYDLQN